jgi:hypothetical protein
MTIEKGQTRAGQGQLNIGPVPISQAAIVQLDHEDILCEEPQVKQTLLAGSFAEVVNSVIASAAQ